MASQQAITRTRTKTRILLYKISMFVVQLRDKRRERKGGENRGKRWKDRSEVREESKAKVKGETEGKARGKVRVPIPAREESDKKIYHT